MKRKSLVLVVGRAEWKAERREVVVNNVQIIT